MEGVGRPGPLSFKVVLRGGLGVPPFLEALSSSALFASPSSYSFGRHSLCCYVQIMTWVLHATQEENDRSRYPLIIAICVVFTLLAIITVALRVHVLITTQGWRFSAIESFISVSLVSVRSISARLIVLTNLFA